jgi:hypothetical protein
MNERGKNLGGELNIHNNSEGGVSVHFEFLPDFIIHRNKNNIAVTDITSIES